MMKKLFTPTISNEMIDPQINDPIVKDLEVQFDKLIELTDQFEPKLVASISYFRHKGTKKVLEDIDKLITKRFGINFKHVSGKDVGYGIITVNPLSMNVLTGDVNAQFKSYKEYLGKTNCNPTYQTCNTEFKESDVSRNIIDLWKDEKSIAYKNYISYMELDKVLNTTGVKIDLHKAKVYGLPKNYANYILVDLKYLIQDRKLNSKELTAVLFHEIGHMFTHLENSYRTVKTTTVLLDTLRKNLVRGKSIGKTLNLVYNDVLDGTEDISKDLNVVATIKVLDRYMESTLKLNRNDNHSYTDSEQLADQFATRFGTAQSLSDAISKLNMTLGDYSTYGLVVYSALVVLSTLIKLILLPMSVMFLIIEMVVTIFTGGYDSNEATYDTELRRITRMKNDLVRMIRTADIDKKDSKRILGEIEYVLTIIDKIDVKDSFISRMGDKILPKNANKSKFKKLEEYLEDLSENDLHVASLKLK